MVGSRSRLLTFDTSIILVLQGGRPVEPDEKERLHQLVEDSRGKVRLGIPAPVMAECGGLRLPDGFECLDFTLDAAYQAQRFIARKGDHSKTDKGKPAIERQRLKVDALIVGTSLAHGANVLYTSNLREFVNMLRLVPDSKMQVASLPKLREWQPDLQGLEDMKR